MCDVTWCFWVRCCPRLEILTRLQSRLQGSSRHVRLPKSNLLAAIFIRVMVKQQENVDECVQLDAEDVGKQ